MYRLKVSLLFSFFLILFLSPRISAACPEGEHFIQGSLVCVEGDEVQSSGEWIPEVCEEGERPEQGNLDASRCSSEEEDQASAYFLPVCEHGKRLVQGSEICEDLSLAKIFTIGDGTVRFDYDGERDINGSIHRTGWGSMIYEFMLHPDNIFNRARRDAIAGGVEENIDSYRRDAPIDESVETEKGPYDWNSTRYTIEHTDINKSAFLLIQFGFPDKLAEIPEEDFKAHLSFYIDEARNMGVEPILVTPVNPKDTLDDMLGAYGQYIEETALDKNVDLIDLHRKSLEVFARYTLQQRYDMFGAKELDGTDDAYHLNRQGAKIVASWVKDIACGDDTMYMLCAQLDKSQRLLVTEAGSDRNMTVDGSVDLNASTYDSLGQNIRYEWREDGVLLSTDPDFIYSSDEEGTHYLVLTAIDEDGNSVTDTITITVYAKEEAVTVTYTEDNSTNLINPHRGFYDADYALEEETDYDQFAYAYDNGYRLVYSPLNLADYNETSTLPDELIDTIESNLEKAQNSGVRLIFRIKYRDTIDGSYDPQRDIILSHLDQLKPLLQEYSSAISTVQAGLIGAWGEWHSFTGDYHEDTDGYIANRKELIEKLVDIFPEKYILIRTPMHKELLFSDTEVYGLESEEGKITEESAYSDALHAKMGHHNDCFLIDETDAGTYMEDNISFWKSYVANDTYFTAMGGETCGEGSDESLSDCNNTLLELRNLHFSFLNDNYHPDVLQKWKDQGCYDYIKTYLGYYLVAEKMTYTLTSSDLNMTLYIRNDGFASPYIAPESSLILKSDTQTYQFTQAWDIRKWYPDMQQELNTTIGLDQVESGSYCLYLKLGDGFDAIRLANEEMWDDNLSANKLQCEIEIE